jgi:hypothetical protein
MLPLHLRSSTSQMIAEKADPSDQSRFLDMPGSDSCRIDLEDIRRMYQPHALSIPHRLILFSRLIIQFPPIIFLRTLLSRRLHTLIGNSSTMYRLPPLHILIQRHMSLPTHHPPPFAFTHPIHRDPHLIILPNRANL